MITLHHYESPCGTLVLGATSDKLCMCDWLDAPHFLRVRRRLARGMRDDFEEGMNPVLEAAVTQLEEYFAGRRIRFDIPLHTVGTDFQKTVWDALLSIPCGVTVTYRELATSIGRPDAVRAVANAVGANALSIFIPCHRVIGTDGTLTGYAGGLPAKTYLLNHEQAQSIRH